MAVLALLCAMTILESVPKSDSQFHGFDFYTISGQLSATETFTKGGTYILHDYSALTPGCNGCKSIEIQTDYGPANSQAATDFYGRIGAGTTLITHLSIDSTAVTVMQPFILVGQNPSPEPPPPRT